MTVHRTLREELPRLLSGPGAGTDVGFDTE